MDHPVYDGQHYFYHPPVISIAPFVAGQGPGKAGHGGALIIASISLRVSKYRNRSRPQKAEYVVNNVEEGAHVVAVLSAVEESKGHNHNQSLFTTLQRSPSIDPLHSAGDPIISPFRPLVDRGYGRGHGHGMVAVARTN